MTARDREIGALVVAGLSSQEIGQRLFISPRTVEKHRANLMEKLHVTNAAALTLELTYLLWEASALAAAPASVPKPARPSEPERRVA